MFTLFVGGPERSEPGFGRPLSCEPPWFRFSGRCPWVRMPLVSTPLVNGSLPSGRVPSAYQVTMIPIVSYHDAFEMSYVACTSTTSPAFSVGRQLAFVTVIATSHDTAPAGSKYFACEWKSLIVLPPRVAVRSV